MQDDLFIPGLPHPHPRHRIYRSEPENWVIKDLAGQELLNLILEKAKQGPKKAACIFDLDGTLFDVGHRTEGIIKEWVISSESQLYNQQFVQKISQINYGHIGYNLAHTFENAGFNLNDEEVLNVFMSVEKLWKKRFFDGQALNRFDTLIPGSIDFVKTCAVNGIKIIYLTGRSARHMKIGTTEQLKKFLFPIEDAEIHMKSDTFMDDHVYKSKEIRDLKQGYNIIANFENEYINLAHMAVEAPEAFHVIVDSQHSGRPAPQLTLPIYRIQSF